MLTSNAASISVSHIGSKKTAIEMLKIADEHQLKTFAQVLEMKDVGKAIKGVMNNDVRYRYVLKVDI